ncbi:MAG: hypothetical protein K2F91_05305 [Muribaculaceae bacterium]|nr:hypothetical protein [Muribaculaceae bacterium]
MRKLRPTYSLRLSAISALLLTLCLAIVAPSCGTIRTHAGIEHDYRYDFDDYGHHHKHKKHHKKHKKHHKHHHHHHHDD